MIDAKDSRKPRCAVVLLSAARVSVFLALTAICSSTSAAIFILLVAMVAAIALTLRQRKDSKAINPSTQIRVRAADRLAVVKVAATQKPAAEESAQAAAEEKKA